MGWISDYHPHYCNFPSDTPRSEREKHWECPECKTVYRLEHTGWTGWWSPDSSDSVRGTTEYGGPAIYCMYETWNTCEPNISFVPVRWGVYGDQKISSYGMSDGDPGEKPEWIVEMEQQEPRPLWAGKEIPGGITEGVDKGGLSRVPSPTDNDLPKQVNTARRATKKRSWLLKG